MRIADGRTLLILIRFTNGVETHLVPRQDAGSAHAAPAANPGPATRR
jgi:hypothetical protein